MTKVSMIPYAAGLFLVRKSFYLDDGTPAKLGSTVELSDPSAILWLLDNFKIEPANFQTAQRIKSAPSSWSEPGQRKPFDPAIPASMGHRRK